MKTTRQPGRYWPTAFLVLASLLLAGCDFEVVTNKGGTIVSSPAGINCRSDSGTCIVRNYERLGDGNDKVTTRLTAIPDDGYRFSHWKGCDSKKNLHCFKNMSGDIRIEAAFAPIKLAPASGNNTSLRFVAMGDWGKGNIDQKLVGDAVARVCNEAGGCNFGIGLGDNIYGTKKPTDAYDDIFNWKFEYPYVNINFPFYMTLGNHDNSLIIDGAGQFNMMGDVQVAYSYRTDRPSDKWRMPSRYYEHRQPQGASMPLASFFSLDSNPFISAVDINPEYFLLKYGSEQGAWFDRALADSRGTWKIAYAHHPYVSNGSHGNAGNYDGLQPLELVTTRMSGESWRLFMQKHVCGKVDLYVAGHDHDVQMLHSVPECGNTMFIVSGAAADIRPLKDTGRNPAIYQRGDALGFVIAELVGDKLTAKFYTVSQADGQATLRMQKTFSRRALN